MRALCALVCLLTVAVLAARASATTPAVSCEQVIGQAKTGRDGGYRVVLGIVSVPPARLRQVVASEDRRWPWWRKAGLVIHASDTPVTVSVPRAWRTRAAITWGDSGTVAALRIAPCPSPPDVWNAYAGGFLLRSRAACVPLTFTVAGRSRTVRFGLGRACQPLRGTGRAAGRAPS